MKKIKGMPKKKIIFGCGTGSFIDRLITDIAKEELKLNGVPKLFRLQMHQHIVEVIHVTIRSELLRLKRENEKRV